MGVGVLAALLARPPLAGASEGAVAADWTVAQGALDQAATPTRFVLTTDASPFAFSYGLAFLREPVEAPYELSLAWRRLSPDARSLEVHVLGGVLLFAEGRLALWIDDDRFAKDGWRDAPVRLHAQSEVVIEQREAWVEVRVDGAVAARFPLEASARGRVGLALKGAPGVAARMRVEDVRARPLDTPRAARDRADRAARSRAPAPPRR